MREHFHFTWQLQGRDIRLIFVNKLCMAHLYSQGNFVSLQHFRLLLLNEYDVYKDTKISKISIKSSHINFSIIFVQFILFKKINVNINIGVIVMFLKHVIIHCCDLPDQTGNTIDEPVQRQHFTLTFIYIENVTRLVLFVVLL